MDDKGIDPGSAISEMFGKVHEYELTRPVIDFWLEVVKMDSI